MIVTNYTVFALNRANRGLEAIDFALDRAANEDLIDGLCAAWTHLVVSRNKLRVAVANACEPWFEVPQ
jgi:hypothetical protein